MGELAKRVVLVSEITAGLGLLALRTDFNCPPVGLSFQVTSATHVFKLPSQALRRRRA